MSNPSTDGRAPRRPATRPPARGRRGRSLDLLLQASPDPIFLLDRQGTILEANQALASRLGRPLEELIGANAFGLLPPEIAAQRRPFFEAAIASGRPNEFEDRWRGRTMHFRHEPLKDRRGRVTRLAVYARDITERRQAEQALRASEEKFARTFRHAPVLMALTDPEDGACLEVNQRFLEATGHQRSEVLGRPSREVGWLRESDRHRLLKALAEQGRVSGLELTAYRKDGRPLTCLLNCEPLEIAGRPCLCLIALDISQRRRAEEEMRRLSDGVAHNFNNVLMAIMSNTQAALDRLEQAPALLPESRVFLDNVLGAISQGSEALRRLGSAKCPGRGAGAWPLGSPFLGWGAQARAAESPAVSRPEPADPAPINPLKILLVEDEAIVAMGLAANLRDAGHQVRHAGALAPALEEMAGFLPDLVLCDLGLPDCSGWEVFLRLGRRAEQLGLKHTPLVVLSGWSLDQLGPHRDSPRQPAAYLQKPVESRHLLEVLSAVAAASRLPEAEPWPAPAPAAELTK